MTADIVVGGLGGDGPIVTAGLGLTGGADPNAMRAVLAGAGTLTATLTATGQTVAGSMTPAVVHVPAMLAAAVEDALMGAVAGVAPRMDPADTACAAIVAVAMATAAMGGAHSPAAALAPAAVPTATATCVRLPASVLAPAVVTAATATGAPTATATMERS